MTLSKSHHPNAPARLYYRDTSGLEGIIDDTAGIIWAILVTYCKLAI